MINNKKQKIVTFNIKEDKETFNMKLDLLKDVEVDGEPYRFTLQSIVLLENQNHFSLVFNSPTYNEIKFPNWIYYNDTKTKVEKWDQSDLETSKLYENNKVPFILGYRKTPIKFT